MKNNRKFLLSGHEVEVIQELPNGFLVASIYNSEGDSEEIVNEGEPYFVKDVYDKAPTQKFDEVIGHLNTQIADYTEKRNQLQKDFWELEKTYKEKLKLYKNYNHVAINLLDNYLENKITHFAYETYSAIGIVATKDIFHYQSDFRLFFEMDLSNNEIKWGTYLKPNSYDRVKAYPCSSYDEAITIANNLFNEVWQKPGDVSDEDSYISCANKLNIPVPESYLQRIKDGKRNRLLSSIEYKEKELETLRTQLS